MDQSRQEKRLPPEAEAAFERAWEGATEFERRRYRRLDPLVRLGVLYLIPAGHATTLREGVALASEVFASEEWEEYKRERETGQRR